MSSTKMHGMSSKNFSCYLIYLKHVDQNSNGSDVLLTVIRNLFLCYQITALLVVTWCMDKMTPEHLNLCFKHGDRCRSWYLSWYLKYILTIAHNFVGSSLWASNSEINKWQEISLSLQHSPLISIFCAEYIQKEHGTNCSCYCCH